MKRAIVVGATSGIGLALAKLLAADGYTVGLASRREPLLQQAQQQIGHPAHIQPIDVTRPDDAMHLLENLISDLGGLDLLVISAGTGFINTHLDWPPERETIDTNVTGFAAVANVALRHFIRQGHGHLVGISSIAALRGNGDAPAYNASKAFMSNYLEGIRLKVAKLGLPIAVTDVRPGFVDTAMAKGEKKFWVATPDVAARQIYRAIRRRKKRAYITRRWSLIAALLKLMPDPILARL